MRRFVTLLLVVWVSTCSCSGTPGSSIRAPRQLLGDESQLQEQALRDASGKGLVGKVEKLLTEGVNVDAQDADGNTPLMLAVLGNKEVAATALLGGGAAVNAKNLKGNSALWLAAGNGAEGLVRLLAERGGDTDAQNNEGVSPILVAAEQGFFSVVKILVSLGADAQLAGGTPPMTPLCAAAANGDEHIMVLLIKSGADLSGGEQSMSPLGAAAMAGQLQAMKILMSKGADINERDTWDGSTPLHMTAQGCQLGVSVWLLDKGADPTAEDMDGNSPGEVVCTGDMSHVIPSEIDIRRRKLQEVLLTAAGIGKEEETPDSSETSLPGTEVISMKNGIASNSGGTDTLPLSSSAPQDVSVMDDAESKELEPKGSSNATVEDCFFDNCASVPAPILTPEDTSSSNQDLFDEGTDTEVDSTPPDDGCFFDSCSSISTESVQSKDNSNQPLDPVNNESQGSDTAPDDCLFDNCSPITAAPIQASDSTAREGVDEITDSQGILDVITINPIDAQHSSASSNRSVIVVIVASVVGFTILGIIIYLFGVKNLAKMPSEEELVARLDADNWPGANGAVKAEVEVVSNLPKELGRSEMLRLASTPLTILPEDPPSEDNGRHPSPVPPLHIKEMKELRKKANKPNGEVRAGLHEVVVVENPRQAGGGAHGGKRAVFADVTSTGNSVIDPPSGSFDLNSRQAMVGLYHEHHFDDGNRFGDSNYENYTEDSLGSLDPHDPVFDGRNIGAGRSRGFKSVERLTRSENPLYKGSNQNIHTYVDSLTGRSDDSRDYQNDRRISLTGSF